MYIITKKIDFKHQATLKVTAEAWDLKAIFQTINFSGLIFFS